MPLSWTRVHFRENRLGVFQITIPVRGFPIAERLRRTVISCYSTVFSTNNISANFIREQGGVVSVEVTRGNPPPAPVTMIGESDSSARDLLWLQRVPYAFQQKDAAGSGDFSAGSLTGPIIIDTPAERREDAIPFQVWVRMTIGCPLILPADASFNWIFAVTANVLVEQV